MKVIAWINKEEAHEKVVSLFVQGGWFSEGDRWPMYLNYICEDHIIYAEALRESIVNLDIRSIADMDNCVPVFEDGTTPVLTRRAWGDFLAAVWSSADNVDFSYQDFYERDVG